MFSWYISNGDLIDIWWGYQSLTEVLHIVVTSGFHAINFKGPHYGTLTINEIFMRLS